MRAVSSAVLAMLLVATATFHAGMHLLELRHHQEAAQALHPIQEIDGDCLLCHAGTPPELHAAVELLLSPGAASRGWPVYQGPRLGQSVDHACAGRAPPVNQV